MPSELTEIKDITLLIAHPDDEALFCWPVLDRVKRIVCASSDATNPTRKWCAERSKCLREVADLLGCELFQGILDSEFYRLPTRTGRLKMECEALIGAIGDPGILYTHNAWGEYGHIDHLLCHHIGRTVQARTGCDLMCSDIAVTEHPAWLPITPWSQMSYDGRGYALGSVEIDRPLFDRIRAIYEARGCWTWSWEPVEKCRVYSL
jgi:GlcNAc-PI de-N-acetylase